MHRMLLLDTCGATGGIVIGTFDATQCELLAVRSLPGRETQETLMASLASLLAEVGIEPKALQILGIVTGPGSFTGVRIGLAAVKGLAEALNLPVVAISRLAVLAAQAGAPNVDAWLDAGRGDVFVGRYRNGARTAEEMLHLTDAIEQTAPGTTVLFAEASLERAYPPGRLIQMPGAAEAFPLAVARARQGNFADIARLDANYLRVPDAELALRRAAKSA